MIVALALAMVAASPALAGDGLEISRSEGKLGGVVVLWPRVTPESAEADIQGLAAGMHTRLAALAESTGRFPIDVRPQPERVCPRQGCKASRVGAVLAHHDGGCAALATVGPPGQTPATLVPWAGVVELGQPTVGYREPPEALLTVLDFVPCTDLLATLDESSQPILDALTATE